MSTFKLRDMWVSLKRERGMFTCTVNEAYLIITVLKHIIAS